MEEGAYGKYGIAQTYALIFGIAYIAVALLEVVLGSDGLVIGDGTSIHQVILLVEPVHNAIHWVTGVVVLGSFFAGESAARSAARVVGVVFLLVTIVGLVAGEFTMGLLGYPDGVTAVPIFYTIVHALTAIGALYAGFAAPMPADR